MKFFHIVFYVAKKTPYTLNKILREGKEFMSLE